MKYPEGKKCEVLHFHLKKCLWHSPNQDTAFLKGKENIGKKQSPKSRDFLIEFRQTTYAGESLACLKERKSFKL